MDGYMWNDNCGSFAVEINPTNSPLALHLDFYQNQGRLYPRVQVSAEPGRYSLQFASAPVNAQWSTITNFLLQSSPFAFFGTTAIDTQQRRFYRAVKTN